VRARRARNQVDPVAQLVEHLAFNQAVVGSTPTGVTMEDDSV